MHIVTKSGKPDLAEIYVARMRHDPEYMIEFVDACDTSTGPRQSKWVVVISTQFGCPVNCLMCDAGGSFKGNLTFEDLKFQVETVLGAHEGLDPNACSKLKVQFARMGEPSLNDHVPEFLVWLKDRYPKVIPCIATIAPRSSDSWFERLLDVRDLFHDFQLQLSINSTDEQYRDRLMPYPKMSWEWLAAYGRRFYRPGQRKIGLNFAICPEIPVNAQAMAKYFDPEHFIIKLTPVNPTSTGYENRFTISEDRGAIALLLLDKSNEFAQLGFEVILSIGNLEENLIGSNCGQAVRRLKGIGAEAFTRENKAALA
jgi:23S rRNA (adenine2503-C2)-methyltransferase